MADTYLNVVDNDDNIVGRQLRSIVHRDGLRHREVHVWFVTKDKKLIFQKRGPHKDTYPNLLDATVGGHVEENQDYMAAALAEVSEESGLKVLRDQLVPLAKIDALQEDASRGIINRVFRMIYLYRFMGEMEDLKVEAGDGAGFEVYSLSDVVTQNPALVAKAVPGMFTKEYLPAWQALRDTLHI